MRLPGVVNLAAGFRVSRFGQAQPLKRLDPVEVIGVKDKALELSRRDIALAQVYPAVAGDELDMRACLALALRAELHQARGELVPAEIGVRADPTDAGHADLQAVDNQALGERARPARSARRRG